MTKNIAISLLLRTIATIVLSSAITFVLYFLAVDIIFQVDILIPSIIKDSISFDFSDVMHDVARNQIIPGWGTMSSIINNPSMGARATLIICIIVDFIILFIVTGLTYLLKKVILENKILTIIYVCIALFFLVMTIRLTYFTNFYIYLGLQRNVWFYIVSIVIIAIQTFLFWGIGCFVMDKDNS